MAISSQINTQKSVSAKPFLKWAGGKTQLLDELMDKAPAKYEKYIEPFIGGGAMFFAMLPEKGVIADSNPELVNVYQCIANNVDQVIEHLHKFENSETAYYKVRKLSYKDLEPEYAASRTIYLNRTCFNGLYRVNQKGEFNVPFGRYKRPYFPEKELYFFAEKAKRATFTCESYTKTFSRARKGNIIYCDPPYAPISKTANFTQYAGNGFNLADQEKLAQLAEHAIEKKSVTVLISNHDTQDTRRFYDAAKITKLKVSRSISQKGHKRQKVGELFALYHPNKK